MSRRRVRSKGCDSVGGAASALRVDIDSSRSARTGCLIAAAALGMNDTGLTRYAADNAARDRLDCRLAGTT